MLRSSLLLLLAFGLAACDSAPDAPPPDTGFSLTVAVQDAGGRPVANQDLVLVYNLSDSGAAPLPPTAATGGAFLSIPFPNPWRNVARLNVFLPEAVATSRLDVFDVEGTLVRTLDLPSAAGQHAVLLEAEPDGAAPLGGGVYRFRATLGDETVERWTVHTDLDAGGRATWGRRLGRTGADGTLRVTDRTVAPGLFDVPPIEIADAEGNALGQLSTGRTATVAAWNGEFFSGEEPSARVTFTDGPVSVTIQP